VVNRPFIVLATVLERLVIGVCVPELADVTVPFVNLMLCIGNDIGLDLVPRKRKQSNHCRHLDRDRNPVDLPVFPFYQDLDFIVLPKPQKLINPDFGPVLKIFVQNDD
jgi:hypothetical protein